MTYRTGQSHQKAVLSDAQVRQMRLQRDRGKTYGQLMRMFKAPASTVRDICTYRTRGLT